VIAQAKAWLDICSRQHACLRSRHSWLLEKNGSALPTRLIDIGTHLPLEPLLRSTIDIDPGSKYLTLSHCWGNYVPKRLLSTNITAMKQSIAFAELSQTFQDAMTVTYRLGLRYIWIDSLCIIQDSRDDWEKESMRMCHIYSNSFCNLCATASVDGSGGLFRDRDVRTLASVRVRAGSRARIVMDQFIWLRNVNDAPLNCRAWVFEEKLLSPRNLHFSARQVFWECNEFAACESLPIGFPLDLVTSSSTGAGHADLGISQRIFRSANHDHPDLYALWASIVANYSNCRLTQETDKLVAFGGIAERMQLILDDTYLAGLWRRHLARHLLWRCFDRNSSEPRQYVAPSWSWASLIGEVHLRGNIDFTTGRDMIDIINTHVELATKNAFGQVKSGTISLRGKLFRLVTVQEKDQQPSSLTPAIWAECLVPAKNSVFEFDVKIVAGTRIPRNHNNLLGLLVADNLRVFEGVLLQATDSVGHFRRLGLFITWEVDRALVEAAVQCFDAKASESGLEYVDDENGSYQYIVTLI
jgi:hypothetical protein